MQNPDAHRGKCGETFGTLGIFVALKVGELARKKGGSKVIKKKNPSSEEVLVPQFNMGLSTLERSSWLSDEKQSFLYHHWDCVGIFRHISTI